jgi:hypothetical protein
MTDPACRTARAALADIDNVGSSAPDHLARCAPCRDFAGRLGRTDAALASAADEAREAALSPALRAPLVAAALRRDDAAASRAAPRGRVLELFLRAAAVAAVLAAAASLWPETLLAEELDLASLAPPDLGLDRAVSEHVERWSAAAGDAANGIPRGPASLALAAALCLAAGLAAARAGSRR